MDSELFGFEDKLQFTKNSYLTVGSVLKNTLKFLCNTKSGMSQPLFIGDSRGILYVTEYKKQEPEIKVKTQPFSREITCVDIYQNVNKEKIYFSFGNSVFVTNRNCKDYAKIEFDIADNINSFRVIDNLIWTVSNNYLSKYEFGEATLEKGTYDNESDITAICLSEFFGKTNPAAIIGSQDNKLKIINGKDVIFSLPTTSTPSVISQFKSSYHDLSEDNYIFGTVSGSHGILNISKDSMKILWEMNQNKNLSEFVGVKTFDINYDGSNEIILIRSNGELSIYATGKTVLDINLISTYDTNEVLTGLDIGKYRNDDENEIMLSSYSGLIFSLTPRLDSANPMHGKTIQVDKKSLVKNLKELNNDVQILKSLYEKRLVEFQKQQNNVFNQITKNPFKVNYKINLQSKEAVYHLKIESEFPMELIIMQSSSLSLDIIEIITKDVNMNIIKDNLRLLGLNPSNSLIPQTNSNSYFICTFKLKEAVHQLELLFRTYESISDVVNCTVVPYNKPKTAFVLEIPIKALSLHKKETDGVNVFKDENILNVLTIKGKFQTSEINQILSEIVPDIPEKTSKESLIYFIKSTFLKTFVEILIEANYCRIRSEFLTPLIIIKEQITRVVNSRKKDMEFNIQVKTLSIFHILEILDPMIQENFNLEIEYKMIQAFKEIDNQTNLPEEYRKILNKSDSIITNYNKRTINLHYLKVLIETLLKDISKVRSINNIQMKIKEITNVFEDYSYDKLVEIFKDLRDVYQ